MIDRMISDEIRTIQWMRQNFPTKLSLNFCQVVKDVSDVVIMGKIVKWHLSNDITINAISIFDVKN